MKLCSYCAGANFDEPFAAKEMMFGSRETFSYALCSSCGSCHLMTELTSDSLSNLYPSSYYSFKAPAPKVGPLKAMLKRARGQAYFSRSQMLAELIDTISPIRDAHLRQLRALEVRSHHGILDVGCGSGKLLVKLHEAGFRKLSGCDPFIEADIEADGFVVQRRSIHDVQGRHDVILFNHSFEHLLDPRESLAAARSLQKQGDLCIIRSPTVSSDSFEKYRENWIELDPPRHFTVPSRPGMEDLAKSTGYRLEQMLDDSEHWERIGSEQYVRGIPWLSEQSWNINPNADIFGKAQIKEFEAECRQANLAHRGGRTAFKLRAV